MEVHGIASFADKCGELRRPGKYCTSTSAVLIGSISQNIRIFEGVYTNVHHYKDWIIERINDIHPEANYTLATCGKSQKLSFWQKAKNWFKNLFGLS